MKHYVVNTHTELVEHEGDRQSCEQYIANVRALYNKDQFEIVEGAAARKKMVGY